MSQSNPYSAHLAAILVAVTVVIGPLLADQPAADRDRPQADSSSPEAADRADIATGHEAVENRIASNIHGTLATITEAALTKQQVRSVVQRLSQEDRQRIGDFADREFAELDARIAQFQNDWRDRYGQEFSIDQRDLVYHPELIRIVYGWTEQAQLARQRQPGELLLRHEEHLREREREREREQQRPGNRQREGDNDAARVEIEVPADQDDPQRRATVILPAAHGLPELAVPLVNEGSIMDAWRIDIPDYIEGPRLVGNLGEHLTLANERKDQWPADVNEAYRMVTHHVLLAVLDVPALEEAPADEQPERQ